MGFMRSAPEFRDADTALSYLYNFLCDCKAVPHNPVNGVDRLREGANEENPRAHRRTSGGAARRPARKHASKGCTKRVLGRCAEKFDSSSKRRHCPTPRAEILILRIRRPENLPTYPKKPIGGSDDGTAQRRKFFSRRQRANRENP